MEIENLDLNPELVHKRKQYVKYFVFSTISLHLFYAVLFYFLELKLVSFINAVSIIVTGYMYYFFSKLTFDFDFLVNFSLYSFTILIYIYVLIFWNTLPITYLWFLCFPLCVLMIKPFKIAIYWTIAIIILSISSPFVSPFILNILDIHLIINFSKQTSLIINYSAIIGGIYMVLLILYYYNEFNNIKIKQLALIDKSPKEKFQPNENHIEDTEIIFKKNDDIGINKFDERHNEFQPQEDHIKNTETDLRKDDEVSIHKFNELYNEIVYYFEEKKPYRNSEFSIHQLAKDLNNNVFFISKALNQKSGTNFRCFLNNYRISEIKTKLINKEHEKYTLKHIYNNAGFISQSTFNRVFKDVEGITPSDFIERLK